MTTPVVYEVLDSMSGSITREQGEAIVKECRRRFVIGQCAGFDDCADQMAPFAPMYVQTTTDYWLRQSLNITAVGAKYFDVVATYRTLMPMTSQPQQPGQPQYVPGSVSFDTTGNREHMTQAISQYSVPGGAPNFEGAINVSGNSVQGIDVVRPSLRYSETWIMPAADAMDCDYQKGLYSLTGTVNQQAFRCFDEGEVLFMGARGQWQGDQPYVAVTFEFEVRANDPNYYPFEGNGGTIFKEGWEHVWLLYEDGVNADTLIKRPVAAYVSQVYNKRDWQDLGIGSASPQITVSPATPQVPVAGAPGAAP